MFLNDKASLNYEFVIDAFANDWESVRKSISW